LRDAIQPLPTRYMLYKNRWSVFTPRCRKPRLTFQLGRMKVCLNALHNDIKLLHFRQVTISYQYVTRNRALLPVLDMDNFFLDGTSPHSTQAIKCFQGGRLRQSRFRRFGVPMRQGCRVIRCTSHWKEWLTDCRFPRDDHKDL
jgi:hypothetical protein